MIDFPVKAADASIASAPLHLIAKDAFEAWIADQPAALRALAEANGFAAAAGSVLITPGEAGGPPIALGGLGTGDDPFAIASVAKALPSGRYHLAQPLDGGPDLAALAWALAAYRFEAFKTPDKDAAKPFAELVAPDGVDIDAVRRAFDAHVLVRDLVNTPSSHMGPEELEAAVRDLADRFGAIVSVVTGTDLLDENYPMIHAVGRASTRAPRLIEFTWGDASNPRLALVGKGVCFDSGGLNIKTGNYMRLMKKDMGGAANVLGLAQMIMDAQLPVYLHVLIPAVENAVGGDAFRPGDVLTARNGDTVEIDNTDAEGRLILADAMVKACEAAPDLMIDMATLTGAARVALGPELAPFYTDDNDLAAGVQKSALAVEDPVWRLPLYKGYVSTLKSDVADVCHTSNMAFAGSITAALFLQRFAKGAGSWMHFDIYAWNAAARPGRPIGGEAQGIRALFHALSERYA